MPTMFRPSPGSGFICAHIRPPPAPGLYWMIVSIAGHFFFSTTCWWRAEMSDSPPGGKACQYIRFLSGQAWPQASGAASRQAIVMSFFTLVSFVVCCESDQNAAAWPSRRGSLAAT